MARLEPQGGPVIGHSCPARKPVPVAASPAGSRLPAPGSRLSDSDSAGTTGTRAFACRSGTPCAGPGLCAGAALGGEQHGGGAAGSTSTDP